MLDAAGRALKSELLGIFARGVHEPLDDRSFDDLACRIFAYQFAHNVPYAAYCRRRNVLPDSVSGWRQIPAVPTIAFREVRLISGAAADVEAVFRTSGTTGGAERRGEHALLDASLYEGSLLPSFAAYVLPDGARLPVLSLVPPAAEAPDSSLAYMIDAVMRSYGAEGSSHFAHAASGLDAVRLIRTLRDAEAEARPVCLVGTSLAFVHLLDALRAARLHLKLPAGSRLMDTGGFKGARNDVEPEALRAAYEERLGVPPERCVNEYGMTELCSQMYDAALHGRAPLDPRRKHAPPWMRSLAADPETLQPLPPGETGILRHFDLANVFSVAAVQTEDLGSEAPGGCVLLGRAPGAAPRGCSIAADLMMTAGQHADG